MSLSRTLPSHIYSLKWAAADGRRLGLQAGARLISLLPLLLQPAKDPVVPCPAGPRALENWHHAPTHPKWWVPPAEDTMTHT